MFLQLILIILFCIHTTHLFASESRSYEIMLPLTLIQSGQSVQSDVSDIWISGKLISTQWMILTYSSENVWQDQLFTCIVPKIWGKSIAKQIALSPNNSQGFFDGNQLFTTELGQKNFAPWVRTFSGEIDEERWDGRMFPWTQSDKKSFGCSYRWDSSLGSSIDTVSYTFIISPESTIFTLSEYNKRRIWKIQKNGGTLWFDYWMFPDYASSEWKISDVILTGSGNVKISWLAKYTEEQRKQEVFSLPASTKKVQFIYTR